MMRALLRSPKLIYASPLRSMLGRLYVLVEHRGRKSGRLYRTVVDRLHVDPGTGEVFVLSAWGETADWYRNVQTATASRVWVGRRSFVPRQRVLGPDEALAIQQKANRERPLAMRFGFLVMGCPFPKTDEELRKISPFLPVVGFRPSS